MKPISFAGSRVEPEHFSPVPERVVSGSPGQTAWNHYADTTGQFNCGVWQGETGSWRVIYAPHEEEFCVLLEGRVKLTAQDGSVSEFAAGDAFVVPGGFTGVWENIGRVRKHYAIMALKEGAV
ncbi:MAG: cupin domain-containing protein [Burkholderiaceae bacterium]